MLLEAGRLARGVSGYTTAKVSSQHGLIYAALRSKFGADAARAYGAANQAALEWIAGGSSDDGIDCDFRRRAVLRLRQPRTATARRSSTRPRPRREAGLPASLVETTPLPYPVAAAVRFDDQAEFHARKYLLALAERLRRRRPVFERSHAVEVDDDERVRRQDARAAASPPTTSSSRRTTRSSTARSPSRACTRSAPTRSLCRIAGAPPEGMFISGDSPTRSIRAVPLDGEELLLVGGEGHKTGTGGDTEERYRALERVRARALGRRVRRVPLVLAGQHDRSTALPYVGRSRRATSRC